MDKTMQVHDSRLVSEAESAAEPLPAGWVWPKILLFSAESSRAAVTAAGPPDCAACGSAGCSFCWVRSSGVRIARQADYLVMYDDVVIM